MVDHIGLKVKDVRASARFYEAALAPLGHVVCCEDDSSAGLGRPGEPVLWLYAASGAPSAGAHIGFRAADRSRGG